ncbi:MAG: carboxylating nicotinate-nucleotide diphosphorylase [Coprobacillaceae bacterium]
MQIQIDQLILEALKEDVTGEDITTNAIVSKEAQGTVTLLAKENGIVAGMEIFKRVFTLIDEEISVFFHKEDGEEVNVGDIMATITGCVRTILTGERTALNYLQRMSGIATYTRSVVKLLEGTSIKVLDTRKTMPNMRIFEKYAVKVGGGYNHRYNLSDGILIKDNHIDAAGGITEAITKIREYMPFVKKIEVEVESMEQVKEAIDAKADIIMLDNMNPSQMQDAIMYINKRALVECSGNITKESINSLKDLGIDYISSGALTHSAPILDISLKHLVIQK